VSNRTVVPSTLLCVFSSRISPSSIYLSITKTPRARLPALLFPNACETSLIDPLTRRRAIEHITRRSARAQCTGSGDSSTDGRDSGVAIAVVGMRVSAGLPPTAGALPDRPNDCHDRTFHHDGLAPPRSAHPARAHRLLIQARALPPHHRPSTSHRMGPLPRGDVAADAPSGRIGAPLPGRIRDGVLHGAAAAPPLPHRARRRGWRRRVGCARNPQRAAAP